jgi:hypothetical protein
MKKGFVTLVLLLTSTALRLEARNRPVDYVNTFLGTAPLTNRQTSGSSRSGGYGPDSSFRERPCPTPWCS